VLGGIADRAGDKDLARVRRRNATTLLAAVGAANPDTPYPPNNGGQL
jgi:hypothetical protein